MIQLSEYHPLSFKSVSIGSDEEKRWLTERYPRHTQPHTRLNLISTLNGSLSGTDGTSETIPAGADRAILKHIRSTSDVVLVGAETIRKEKYRTPSSARLATITNSGNLTGHQLDPNQAGILVFCSTQNKAKVTHELGELKHELIAITAETPEELITGSIHALHTSGLDQIVCEGGATLAKQMLRLQLIDEVCLSIRPIATQPHEHQIPFNINPDAKLLGALVDTVGISYLRLQAK